MRNTDNASKEESRRQVLQKGAIACGGAISGLGVLSGTVAAEPIEISECTDIEESGEYILTNDISTDGDCISVFGGDIIIDGNGHTISGDGEGVGISTDLASTVIRDLTIEGFETGIKSRWSDIELDNTLITENTDRGLIVTNTDLDVQNSTVSNNMGTGIYDVFLNDIDIVNSTLSGNSGFAYTTHEGLRLDMKNCTVTGNGNGVMFGSFSEIKDNEIRGNDGLGLGVRPYISYPRGNLGGTIIGNNIQNNAGPGIAFIYSGADVIENTIANNEYGVHIPENGPIGGKLSKNNIEGNEKYGVKTESTEEIEATCNYWGHATGPDHEDNPRQNPKGDKVSGDLDFTPWSVREIRDGEGSCNGGRGGRPN